MKGRYVLAPEAALDLVQISIDLARNLCRWFPSSTAAGTWNKSSKFAYDRRVWRGSTSEDARAHIG